MDLTVTDNLYEARYEASFNGELAGTLEYELTSDLLILIHTEVLPGHQDQGVGGQLAKFALDDARSRGCRSDPCAPSSAHGSSGTLITPICVG